MTDVEHLEELNIKDLIKLSITRPGDISAANLKNETTTIKQCLLNEGNED